MSTSLHELVIKMAQASYTAAPWSTPKSNLSAEDYCAVTLIDDNEPDKPKIKALCHLPVRSQPGGPLNKHALQNAAARLTQTKARSSSLAGARKKLIDLLHQAGMETSLEKSTGPAYGLIDVIKAYPNEHAARQLDQDLFVDFARKQLAAGVTAIIGMPKVGGSKVQSLRFDRRQFSAEEAQRWLKEHDFSSRDFEAATAIEKMGPTLHDVHVPGIMELDSVAYSAAYPGDPEDSIEDEEEREPSVSADATDIVPSRHGTISLGAARPYIEKSFRAEIFKSDSERRIAYAVAYKPHETDTQDDRMVELEIEKMAHGFMIDSQHYDLQHQTTVPQGRAYVVESYIAPVDIAWPLPDGSVKQISKGSWIVATFFKDQRLWNLVKSGTINAYSIWGRGIRKQVEA